MRNLRTLLLAGAALATSPAMALEQPAPHPEDPRLRVVRHNPQQVVQYYLRPGSTGRITLMPGERVVGIFVSDQRGINPDEYAEMVAAEVQASRQPRDMTPQQSGQGQTADPDNHCDANLCRSVRGHVIYLLPRVAMDPQPMFVQTEWCHEGKCEPDTYAFELLTREEDPGAAGWRIASSSGAVPTPAVAEGALRRPALPPVPFFGVRFTYPERERAIQTARANAAAAERRRRFADRPPPPAQPQVSDQWRYAYQGAGQVEPDEVWDNTRTTFLLYRGARRLPNVYVPGPGATCRDEQERRNEATVNYTVEPRPDGNVIVVGKTAPEFILRDGERLVGCVINFGGDPDGRNSMVVRPVSR